MLSMMREKLAGIVTATIIIILCLAFALWGVQYYLTAQGGLDTVAKVNGTKITQGEFRSAFERARQQMMAQMGKKFSFDQATQSKLRQQVLKQLVQAEAVHQEATNIGFAVSDKQIDAFLTQMPAFQVAGQFSEARFQQILSRMLFSEGEFLQGLRQNIIINQLQTGIVGSAFALPDEAKHLIQLLKQERDIGYAIIPVAKFMQSVKVSSQDIANYYQKNKKDFTLPEKVNISYIVLSQEDLAKQVKVSDAALQEYYDNNIDVYSHPKEWQVARAFVPVAAKAPSSQVKDAQTKIAGLLKQAKSGIDFSQLDISYGKPTLLNQQQMPGTMFKAVNALKAGAISDPIRTEQGFFIVKLLQVKAAETAPFSKVKERVRKAYVQQQAAKIFAQKGDDLSDLTYTNANSLAPAAKKLGVQIQTTALFTAKGLKSGIASKAGVVKAAFSDNVLQQKYNSDAIDLGAGRSMVMRINKHIPQTVKPLSAVQAVIKQALLTQAAQAKVDVVGKELLQQIQQGKGIQSVIKKNGLDWESFTKIDRKSKKVDPQILDAAFDLPLPSANKPQVMGIDLINGGYALVAATKYYPGDVSKLSAQQLKAFKHALATAIGMHAFNVYTHNLVQQAKIKIIKKK
ncbi:MAG: SurA N-terminal domain-containing protein [Gammaproteobacteria bacterium]|nr:SurA N-terminal domain-containing protein [Gammaproteobacteria bacterium]